MSTNRRWTAPVESSSKIDVPLLPADFQLCTLFGLVDMGTQETNFGKKRQLKMFFEFPQHMAVFYEGDDPRPHSVICTESFSMAPKSNLRNNLIQPMLGRKLTDTEADSFVISELLGKNYVATISHSADGKYANIDGIKPLTEANAKMFGLSDANVDRVNDIMDYHLNDGFDSESFKAVSKYFRDKIAGSEEGMAHKAKGGKFAEPEKRDNGYSNNDSGNKPSAPSSGKKLVMISTDYTYEQYNAKGWSDEDLVNNGHAKWETSAPVAPPSPKGPPSAPSAPPSVPSAPLAPPVAKEESKPVLKMKDPEKPYDKMIEIGWTDELLVEHGHAIIVNSSDGSPYEGDDLPF